jgi:hypothetical protein
MGDPFMRQRMMAFVAIVAFVLVVAPPAVGPVLGGIYLMEELRGGV